MSNCPRCSSPLAEGAVFCGVCGHKLAPAAARPALSKMTMVGVAAVSVPGGGRPTSGPGSAGTTAPMAPLGEAAPATGAAPSPAHRPPAGLGSTVLLPPSRAEGMTRPLLGEGPTAPSPAAAPPPAPAPSPGGAGLARTMLGVAVPAGVAGPAPAASPPGAGAPAEAPPGDAPRAPWQGARTMVGMASPVAAPLAAGAPAGASPQGGQTRPLEPYARLAPPTPSNAPPPMSAGAPDIPVAAPLGGGVPAGKGKTIVGMAAPAMPAPSPAPPPGKGKTIVGVASPALGPAPAAPAKKTLLGMAPPSLSAPGKGKTMIGVASPLAGQPAPGKGKTLLGFAVPAVLRPVISEPEYVEEFYDEVEPGTGEVQRRVRMVEKPLPPFHRRPAFAVLVGAVMLAVGGGLALALLKGPAPVTAEARLDAEGHDVLHVVCKSCPDGTKLSLPGAEAAVVKASEADLRMTGRLKVGDNDLALALDRPEGGRDETVQLKVPVAYRIAPDLNALQDATPAVRVDVEAVPGSTVSVQGKPVALDAAGRGSTRVEVGAELLALAPDARTFERDIAYTIASPGASPASGKLSVRTGVASLTIESPGAHLITDQPTFLLAGRAARGAGVTVAGAPVPVGPDGAFRQYLKIPTVGEAEVPLRASAHGLAPRMLSLRVKLVPALAAEARAAEAAGRPGYSDVAGKLDRAAGTAVAWRGEVVSANATGAQVIAVLDVTTGCTQRPCRARVVVPGASALSAGERLGVYGRVTGASADTRGERLLDVEADFVLRQP